MSTKATELVAALSALEGDEEHARPDAFQEVLSDLTRHPAPAGALQRLFAFGGLQAQVAVAYVAYWLRNWFIGADRREQELSEAHLRAAIAMLRTMGYLRGAAMKLGQTLANFPDLVPDQIVATLERLHFEAPPMHFALLREHVHNEFGRDPEEAFATFDRRAFAAASLGQVHRATLKSGEDVAVKIQYPAIGRSIRSDFRNLSAVLLPLRLGRGWEPIRAQLEEVRRVIDQETDYEREAEWQRRARSLFFEDDPILVPRVHDGLSTRRVLTMEYIDGVHIRAFLAGNPPQELRDRFGELIIQAEDRLHYAGRLLYGDPHPGNYLFRDDGRLGFLDFGCVRPYTDREWECCRLCDLAVRGDRDDVVRALRSTLGLAEGDEIDPDLLAQNVEFGQWMWRPYRHEGPFDFGEPAYLREGVDLFAAIGRARIPAPFLPMNAFIARWYFGTVAMLYRLRARVDMRAIYLRERLASGWGPA
jgi:predicted unusual protein kinase regulating ubiquinone biosynthesis (AarF/ABC1/UbiB family)